MRHPAVPVHPRSRGEHNSSDTKSRVSGGSSPLARGTRIEAVAARIALRFIPARAGNTRPTPASSAARTVHPRSRGEHGVRCSMPACQTGSSPLARGTPGGAARGRSTQRFIPARAGNTCAAVARCRARPVHPRSRGEHWMDCTSAARRSGSSPLARGTRGIGLPSTRCKRFIPARAGNTHRGGRGPHRPPVHPRSRGEHATARRAGTAVSGSSPLARGTPPGAAGDRDGRRFIPARAGNTVSIMRWRSAMSVHPRSRGEHAADVTSPREFFGSSPLARGTRGSRPRDGERVRFIPARAGNTPQT